MPKERHYISLEFFQNQEIRLEGPEFHHLVIVMRKGVGDTIELVNGFGGYAQAALIEVQKKWVLLKVVSFTSTPKGSSEIILAQAIPRLQRLDFILEKGTELGMTALWLFPGYHSEKKELSSNQMERLRHMTVAAMKQCGRLFLPEIVIRPPLQKWEKPLIPLYYGTFAHGAPLFLDQWAQNTSENGIFCIGPESGWHPSEEEALNNLGGLGVKLHTNILRTETAAITALALMTHTKNK